MSKATTKKDEIPESKIRQVIWMLKVGKTKKACCEFLGISYNTTKLQKLIDDLRAKEQREKELKEKAKNLELTEAIRKDIAFSYINGEAQSSIAARYYISPQRVKKVLLEMNVPIRARSKNGEAKTEHIVQDLDVKLCKGDRVFYGKENCFAYIIEVVDEEYAEKLRQGRQRYVETYAWTPKSKFNEPQEGIHYEIYWELETGESFKLSALSSIVKRVEDLIAETGRETYNVYIEGDFAMRKLYVPRSELFPIMYK